MKEGRPHDDGSQSEPSISVGGSNQGMIVYGHNNITLQINLSVDKSMGSRLSQDDQAPRAFGDSVLGVQALIESLPIKTFLDFERSSLFNSDAVRPSEKETPGKPEWFFRSAKGSLVEGSVSGCACLKCRCVTVSLLDMVVGQLLPVLAANRYLFRNANESVQLKGDLTLWTSLRVEFSSLRDRLADSGLTNAGWKKDLDVVRARIAALSAEEAADDPAG